MTDAQKQTLAAEYKRLEKQIALEKENPCGSLAVIRYCEDKMATIETKFQQADADISLWIR